jgi:hypothetical protein
MGALMHSGKHQLEQVTNLVHELASAFHAVIKGIVLIPAVAAFDMYRHLGVSLNPFMALFLRRPVDISKCCKGNTQPTHRCQQLHSIQQQHRITGPAVADGWHLTSMAASCQWRGEQWTWLIAAGQQ